MTLPETITLDELRAYEIPDLSYYALMFNDKEIVNGFGESLDVPKVLAEYHEQLRFVIETALSHQDVPEGYEFFVPDLWHESKGDARNLPGDDGELVWNSTVTGMRLGRTYFDGLKHAFRHKCPGITFVNPKSA